MQQLIEQYIACWNERDRDQRRALIGRVWADDASYVDPLGEAHGSEQIEDVIAAAQAQFPSLSFTLTGPVDAHHNQTRFTWGLGPAGADPVVEGFHVER